MQRLALLLLVIVGAVFSQQVKPTSQQIDEGKRYIDNNPEAAQKKISQNQALFNSLSAEQQQEILSQIKTSESRKKVATDSLTDSVPRRAGYAQMVDSLIDSTMLDSLDFADTLVVDTLARDTLTVDTVVADTIIYGHHLFSLKYRQPEFTEIPDEYVIAPGDEILLRFWGRYNQEQKYLIGKDGYVFIEPLNRQLFLPGMTYGELRAMIQRVSTSSPGVQGDVRLVNAHPIYVNIAGHAAFPGTVSAPASYTFWQVLMLSRGPSRSGSVRDIMVSRKGKMVAKIDIYDFLRNGREPVVSLKNEDLIFFGKRRNIVTIDSLVRNPGKYEMVETEQIADLIDLAGGVASNYSSPRILIDRIADYKEKAANNYPRFVVGLDLSISGWEKTLLRDGDYIRKKNLPPRAANEVYISGSGIRAPGSYSIPKSGLTIESLIKEAGGLAQGAFSRGELLRLKPDGSRFNISIDITKAPDIQTQLVSYDSILTYNDSQFITISTVQSRGFVKKETAIPFSDSLSLMDVICRSEGTLDGALPYVYIKRTDDQGIITYHQFEIVDSSATRSVLLQKRDEVLFFNYRDFNAKLPVTVLAFDRKPMVLDYSSDLTLKILIHELNGLHPLVDSQRVEICNPDYTDGKIYMNMQGYSLDAQTIDRKGIIKDGSIVFFRKDIRKDIAAYVFLEGEVLRPGRYALMTNDYRLSDIFKLSGGITDRGNKYAISIRREGKSASIPVEIRESKGKDTLVFSNDWVLNRNDRIKVGRNDYSVEVAGAVFDPRTIAYNTDYSWSDYIKKGAGGFIDSASVSRTYIQYPNGITKKAQPNIFSKATVVPGSKIVVPLKPPKPPRQPGDGFDYVKGISAISSSMITVLSLLIIAKQL